MMKMQAQFDSVVKQLRVLQQRVQSLTEQLHALTSLHVDDYVVVTCIESGNTVVHSGFVRQIHTDALYIEDANGTVSILTRFLDLRIVSVA